MLVVMTKNRENLKKNLMCLNQNLYPVKSFDDTTVFLKIAHQIPVTMQDIEFFSKASGLYIDV